MLIPAASSAVVVILFPKDTLSRDSARVFRLFLKYSEA
jgi:hypothetical protein